MAISFAGVDLLLNDESQLAEKFARSYSAWPQAVINLAPPVSAGVCAEIKRPNWPQRPSLGINQLYFPTGCSRWACGLFLTDREGVEALAGVLDGELTMDLQHAVTFIDVADVTWNVGDPFSVNMHKLEPIPLSTPELGNDDTLWVIPLVDCRYFWQGLTLHLKEADTWTGLITELATALTEQALTADTEDVFIKRELDFPGTLTDEEVSIPDPCFFGDHPVNAAHAMDAACWALGLRFVPEDLTKGADQDSTRFRLMNPTTRGTYPGAAELYAAQRDELFNVVGGAVAGGDFQGEDAQDIPSEVQMLFAELPMDADSESYTATQSLGLDTSGNFAHRVWCPAVPTADNHADLDTLAELWTGTLAGWLEQRMRWTWAGGPTLRFSGFEDYQLFEHSIRGGVPRGMTRIESLPRTWGWEFVPLQLPDGTLDCCGSGSSGVIIGRALSAIAPASSNIVGSAFTFVKFIVDDGDATPKLLKEELDGEEPKATDGVNRSTKRSASVDAFVTLAKNNGEWVLLTVDEVCVE